MQELPEATYPPNLSESLKSAGKLWAGAVARPRVLAEVERHWDGLVDEWAASDLPLIVRKGSGVRGRRFSHASGRAIIVADNSPAQWSFMRAFQGHKYSLGEIRKMLEAEQIPVAFATKRAEAQQVSYRGILSQADCVNRRGWKLCHVKPVGLRSRMNLEEFQIADLKNHFQLLIRPSNHFLVPLAWAGLGELPEVIEELRNGGGSESPGVFADPSC